MLTDSEWRHRHSHSLTNKVSITLTVNLTLSISLALARILPLSHKDWNTFSHTYSAFLLHTQREETQSL